MIKIISVIALSLFLSTHPVIGILGLFAAYELIKRSKHNASGPSSLNALIHQVAPGESYRSKYMEATQVTYNSGLEEALVGQVPVLSSQTPANYRDANSTISCCFSCFMSALKYSMMMILLYFDYLIMLCMYNDIINIR